MTITQELADILADVKRPGDYFVSGRAELLAPKLEVEGVGPIALPLLPAQAKQLIKAATRAPFGRGADTVVDTKVRRTWQIAATQVRIGGKHWEKTLNAIVARAAEGLGVTAPVTAELYKLLIYDKGSFFVGHRDTEKAAGMFATLVLALPSDSTGGELVVRHKDREARLDLSCDEPSEIAFAAFYADCVHEVLPVTKGCRATLVFNLVRKTKGKARKGDEARPPNYDAEAAQITALLGGWSTAAAPSAAGGQVAGTEIAGTQTAGNETAGTGCPLKIVYPLEHAYTPAELSFAALKGADAAVARLLAAATPDTGVDLHLALLTVEESGSAQYVGGENWHYRRGRRDAGEEESTDEFEVVEVYDGSRTLSEWRRPDGAPAALGKLPVEDDEIAPSDALDDMEPDEEHFREATGNEGASFERTYSRAALVLWPKSLILAVLNQAGLAATLPYLDALIRTAQAKGAAKSPTARQQALELAGHMLATWPEHRWHDRNRTESTDMGRLLAMLARLGDAPLVEAMITKLLGQQGHDRTDNRAILAAIGVLAPDRATEILTSIVAAGATDAPGACAALLVAASKGPSVKKSARLVDAATALVAALPGDPASAPQDQWGRPRVTQPDAALVADLVVAVDRIDAALAGRAATQMLAWPRNFDPDAVLVPAIKKLLGAKQKSGPAFEALHQAAVAHLETRIGLALEAPRDWTRPSRIGCQCAHCAELSRFLADPLHETWTLKAAAPSRGHVEAEIKRANADLEMRTERRGSPHQLICTKNQASYRRRVVQRKQDTADIQVLLALKVS